MLKSVIRELAETQARNARNYDTARRRAASRGETVSEAVRKSLVNYNKPRKGEA